LYHAIAKYGTVPCTVARMLKRPLRVHIVGSEKELNFLDLFKEVAFLLPSDLALELVFVTRHDMLPTNVRESICASFLRIDMIERLSVTLLSGSFGDSKIRTLIVLGVHRI
jgi:hypothetical protein